MSSRWWLALVGVLAIVAPSAPAQAQPSDARQLDAARALANAGLDLFNAGRHEEALERFRGAERIHHAPPHVLYIARSLLALGRLVEARDAYRSLAEETIDPGAPPVFASARQEAIEELEELRPRIAHVTIEVEGEGASLAIDGRPVTAAPGQPFDVDPGDHRVTASKAGMEDQEQNLSLGEGESTTLRFAIPDGAISPEDDGGDAATSGGSSLVGPIVLLSVGGAGLILGGVMGGLAFGKRNALEAACPNPASCPIENRDLEDDGRTFGHVSTAGFVVGGVAAAAGLTWLLLALPDDESSTAVRPYASPWGAGVVGRF